MLSRVKTVVSRIDETCYHISVVIMTVVAVLGVFMRYVINNPLLWCEEVLMILVVWSVFFGASVAVRDRCHIAVDILFDVFPKKVQMVLDALIWCFVTYGVVWIGITQVNRTISLFEKAQTSVVLHFPKCITYGVVAFACLLMLINHIIVGIEDFQKICNELKGGVNE